MQPHTILIEGCKWAAHRLRARGGGRVRRRYSLAHHRRPRILFCAESRITFIWRPSPQEYHKWRATAAVAALTGRLSRAATRAVPACTGPALWWWPASRRLCLRCYSSGQCVRVLTQDVPAVDGHVVIIGTITGIREANGRSDAGWALAGRSQTDHNG